MMGGLDSNPFAYLTQTICTISTWANVRRISLLPQDKSLLLTIINVLLEIHHVLGRKQVPTVCTLDNTRWRGRRASRRVAIDYKCRSRRGRRLLEINQHHNHLQGKKRETCPRVRFRPRLLSPVSAGTVGEQGTAWVSSGVDVVVVGSSMYVVCCSYGV